MTYLTIAKIFKFPKVHGKGIALFVALAGFLSFSAPISYADPIHFDFGGSGGLGSIGNSLTFTSGGITITATAWGYTHDIAPGVDNALGRAGLGQYGSGLGVCDQSEWSCGDPGAQVDNVGPDNWVLFTFSERVDPVSIQLYVTPWIYPDWDVVYRVGNVPGDVDLTGVSYMDPDALGDLGFGAWVYAPPTPYEWPMTVGINGSQPINALFIGARFNDTPTDEDGFKISTMDVNPVPEPASLLLLGTGLMTISGLSIYRRKRKQE